LVAFCGFDHVEQRLLIDPEKTEHRLIHRAIVVILANSAVGDCFPFVDRAL